MNISIDSDQQILEEDYDENYEPTEEEILEYCKVLGLDPAGEKDLLYIAKEGIKAPLPKDWKPVEDGERNIYYFNFTTGQSTWEHPCDEFYRKLLQQERGKKAAKMAAGKKTNAASKSQTQTGNTSKGHNSHGNGIIPGKMGPIPSPMPHGRLAPLSMPGAGGLGGLPLLRSAPHSLAPLRVPPGMPQNQDQTGSKLGSSITSTGKSGTFKPGDLLTKSDGSGTFKPGDLLTKNNGSLLTGSGSNGLVKSGENEVLMKSIGNTTNPKSNRNGDLEKLGTVDLGSVRISNQYEEEEEEEESDFLEDSSSNPFRKRLGLNLLGAKDLGLKDTDEELESPEDVNRELRKVLDLTGSDTDYSERDNLDHPFVPPTSISGSILNHPAALLTNGPQMSASSPVTRPQSNGVRTRPSHGASRGVLGSAASGSQGLLSGKSQSSHDGGLKATTKTASNDKGEVPSSNAGKIVPLVSKDEAGLQAEFQKSIAQLKKSHEEQLDKLRRELADEVKKLKESLRIEKEKKMAEFKKALASDQKSEEASLKGKKEAFLNELKAQLKREEEDEEARLMEGKQDAIRKLKHQISMETEKLKKELQASKDTTLRKLKQEITEERGNEERKIRSVVQEELKKLKQEMEREREELESAHKKELETLRQESEEDLEKERESLKRKSDEELKSLQEKAKKEYANARAEAEKSLNPEAIRSQIEESFKKMEIEMKEKLAANLKKKNLELTLKHETQLAALREELEAKVKQAQEEASKEMEAERMKLETELTSAKNSHTKSRALESMGSEYKTKKMELSRQQEELQQQMKEVKDRKQTLQEEETELKVRGEKLSQLKLANTEETEKLLRNQYSELRDAITKEKKKLTSLTKSRQGLECEIQEFDKQKSLLELRIKGLRRKEKSNHKTREKLPRDIKEVASPTSGLPSMQTTPVIKGVTQSLDTTPIFRPPANGRPLSSSPHTTSQDGQQESAREGKRSVKEELESWMAGDGDKESDDDTAMNVRDLEVSHDRGHASRSHDVSHGGGHASSRSESEESSVALESVQARLARHQRELHDTLAEEKRSLDKTKAYLRQQQQCLRQRQSALQRSHQEWSKKMKSYKGQQHNSQEGNVSLMKDIQTKLDQEAAALAELEDRMKSSNKLLTLKEQAVTDLQASIDSQTDALNYLGGASLEPSAHHLISNPKTRYPKDDSIRASKRPLTRRRSPNSPLLLEPQAPDSAHTDGMELRFEFSTATSSEEETSSSLSSDVSCLEKPTRALYSSSTAAILSGTRSTGGGRRAGDQDQRAKYRAKARSYKQPRLSKDVEGKRSTRTLAKTIPGKENGVFSSLQSINLQLCELLDRVGGPGNGGVVAGGVASSVLDPGYPSSFTEEPPGLPLANSSARWADPMIRSTEVDPRRKHSYLGHNSVVGAAFAPGTPTINTKRSTEELMKNQTDWLKEFQRTVPLASQLRADRGRSSVQVPTLPLQNIVAGRATTSSGGNSTLRLSSPQHASHSKPPSFLPGKPRLILDTSNNIQLIHV